MPTYTYTAVTIDRQRLAGSLVASSTTDAAARLVSQSLTVVSLSESSQSNQPTGRGHSLSLDEKVFLTQNLGTLLKSGIPIAEALATTATDAPTRRLRDVLQQVTYDVRSGRTLAASFAHFPTAFDSALLALVEAGEEAGKLDEMLLSLTEKFRQEAATLARVKNALVYPAIVLLSLVLLGAMLVFFALPKITTVFDRFAIDLPIITKWLIGFSKVVNANRLLGLLVVFGGLASLSVVVTLPATRRLAVTLASRLPWLSQIVSYLDVERFTSTLAILMRAGVPIQRALEVAGRAVTREAFARQIPLAAHQVGEGKRLAEALAGSALPSMALSLIAAGERSGNLAENLENLATYYRDHLEESLRTFTALIEPTLTLIVGLVIGVVVISIIAPIYQLIGQLNGGGQ